MKRLVVIVMLLMTSIASAQDVTEIRSEIRERIEKHKTEFIQIRRQIHQNPELGNREFETAALIAQHLKRIGYDVQENVAHTGVVAVMYGKKNGRVVALRADMDALPIIEQTDFPFKSQNEGVMHACGHDVHVTVGLGAATILSEMKDKLNGTVKFLFQPAEEGAPAGEGGGASMMIEEGALDNPAPEVIFGLHCGPDVEVGSLGYTLGGAMASSDGFSIVIKGKGTHAAYPWEGIDPIVIGSHVVIGLQNIRSRMTDTRKPVVVSVGMFQGGNRSNIIPMDARLVGTVRTHDQENREKVKELMEQIVSGICSSYGAEYEFNYRFGAPVTFNNHELCQWSAGVRQDVLGKEKVQQVLPSMGAEDFALYGQKIPAFFYWLGVRNESKGYTAPIHNPKFSVDEDAIPVGVEAMTNLAITFLNSDKKF